LKDVKEAKEMAKRERETARTAKREKRTIEGDKWDRAKVRHEARLRKWRRECNTLDKREACPPKPHRRLKAVVIEGESSSSCSELSEDEGDESMSTSEPPSGDSGDEDT
jgi:hypothetical protein